MNVSVLIVLVVLIAVALIARRRGARMIAVGSACAAVLPAMTLWQTSNPFLLAGLLLVLVGAGWQRYGRTAATVTRWGAALRRKSGVASGLDIYRNQGSTAMRRRAGTLRPSLKVESRRARLRQLARLRVTDVAVRLCRVGATTVWAAVEEVVIVFGGPRKGKTQWWAGQVVDAPGAVIVTSTRTDLLDQVGPLRAGSGPVYVFNPVGLAGMESTITFDPLTGCESTVTASERATDLLAAGTMSGGAAEREFWEAQARRVLTALLHAAALGDDLTMRDVQRWVADPDKAKRDVTSLLRKSTEPALREDATQFLTTNDRTRSSITSTIMPALGWLTHDAAAAAATGPRTGGVGFDVAELLTSRATVYLLGAEETQTAPLVSALTGHIAREARRIAAHPPGGRLDPNLTLALDEAALICPVPLHQWTADMGGRGVTIIAAFQSRAQVLDRYGESKAEVILNNSAAVMVFGGTRSREDLTYWSTLGGERDEPTLTTDMHGRVASRTTRRVPVLAPAQIANLPAETVVTFRRGMPPVIGRVQMAYRRPDVRGLFFPEAFDVRTRARVLTVLAWFAARVTRPVRAWLLAHVGTPLARWFARVWAWVAGVARGVLVALRLRRPAPPAVDLVKATPLRALPPWLPDGDGDGDGDGDDDSDERRMP
jgi:hypothetical protein